ncbi:MAG: NUDIX domain-containing protein [Candidatus Daviesbacteria bacterium]|nr:NUDIX domain-containing protein [Candidatus Daviesbacteria bacterium]
MKLVEQVKIIAKKFADLPVSKDYLDRVEEGGLTRDENVLSHFCVYFAAYDPGSKEVFIGHHKKSGLWLFNGGHVDKGEALEETLFREMGEEWGVQIPLQNLGEPRLITVANIINSTNNPRMKCIKHYDIWYFVPVSKASFAPEKERLDTEFSEIGWKNIKEARALVTDPSTIIAITKFEKIFNDSNEEN